MRGLIYNLLDWTTSHLIDWMIMLEPKPPRRQELDYHVCDLPDEILAIVRVSWYKNGRADEIGETVLYEQGEHSYDDFTTLIISSLRAGANVSISSSYQPKELGIET
ncbi:MAG: hypothetical protein ACK5SP_01465 [bacterium]|jgi:hypothetical protein